jgi:hypothetical protein
VKTPTEIETFRYVLHDDVECYLQAGWAIAADLSDCYHGQFGVLMLRPPVCTEDPLDNLENP